MDITVEPRGGPTLELDLALSLEAPAGHGECSSYQPSLLICTALIDLCRADFAQVHLQTQVQQKFMKKHLQGKVCALTTSTAHLHKRTLILPGGIWRRSTCSRRFIYERKCSRSSETTKEGKCGCSWPGSTGAQLGALSRSSCREGCVLLPPSHHFF